ncbi:hypothetical protein C8J57DRAFT_1254233 [Mycena rebaudengoi]|nr:hypothetical protein C8J57DRAFT_1254233 [Mycena rebaudengoi]
MDQQNPYVEAAGTSNTGPKEGNFSLLFGRDAPGELANVPTIYLQYTGPVYSKYTGLMTNSPLNLSCYLNIYFTCMAAFYTIFGGSVPEVVDKLQTSPAEDCNLLSPANHNKDTSRAEANTVLDLHKVFQYHKHTWADQQPETFAKPIGASAQVTDPFATTGPFYAVYNGKTESVIYVQNPFDAEKQVRMPWFI